MPEGIKKENKEKDEEPFGSESSGGSFGFEEADVNGLEKKFEVRNHLTWSTNCAGNDLVIPCSGDRSLPEPEILYLPVNREVPD